MPPAGTGIAGAILPHGARDGARRAPAGLAKLPVFTQGARIGLAAGSAVNRAAARLLIGDCAAGARADGGQGCWLAASRTPPGGPPAPAALLAAGSVPGLVERGSQAHGGEQAHGRAKDAATGMRGGE